MAADFRQFDFVIVADALHERLAFESQSIDLQLVLMSRLVPLLRVASPLLALLLQRTPLILELRSLFFQQGELCLPGLDLKNSSAWAEVVWRMVRSACVFRS